VDIYYCKLKELKLVWFE